MNGLYLEVDRSGKSVLPYSNQQLKALFTSPLFTSCAGDDREHESGSVKIRDWRYWLPWILLYTGARLGEIAQLLTTDLRQSHGVWIFHIHKDGPIRKSVKTPGSERVVPVHSKLIELGLLDYYADMLKRGELKLFPELQPNARGQVSGEP